MSGHSMHLRDDSLAQHCCTAPAEALRWRRAVVCGRSTLTQALSHRRPRCTVHIVEVAVTAQSHHPPHPHNHSIHTHVNRLAEETPRPAVSCGSASSRPRRTRCGHTLLSPTRSWPRLASWPSSSSRSTPSSVRLLHSVDCTVDCTVSELLPPPLPCHVCST